MQEKSAYWRRLDNAAKIFPATSNPKDTRVFRFYCELKEEIEGIALQEALNRTLQRYPLFLSVMRKGVFWHYLEKSELKPEVRKEYKSPCANLYVRDKKTLLFEVTYYKKRINFEVYHSLTDGTGATEFLRELVKNYLVLIYEKEGLKDINLAESFSTFQDYENDSFTKYYQKERKAKRNKASAFQLKRTTHDRENLRVVEGVVSVQKMKEKAKEYNVSVTVFITAVFLQAIFKEMNRGQKKKPIVLMVPVNLRQFFESDSMLNFWGWIEPSYDFSEGEVSLEKILEVVKAYFEKELTTERVEEKMCDLIALEKNPILRMAPLELKNVCMLAGARAAEKNTTAIYSNMGIINMPEEYKKYIDRFGVFTSTPKLEMCMCSFEDKMSFSFTARFDMPNIHRNFFRVLSEMGVESEILEEDFPEIQKPEYLGMEFFKRSSFVCIVVAVVIAIINLNVTPNSYWGLITCSGILSMWSTLAVGFFKRHNLLKNAVWQLVLVNAGAIIWDISTKWKAWSLNYVLPLVSLAIIASLLILIRVLRLKPKEYMIYLFMVSAYASIVPGILLLLGLITLPLPSTICVGIGIVTMVALSMFKRRELTDEFEKKFHV